METKRSPFLKCVPGILAVLNGLLVLGTAEGKPLNIVFFLVDDLGVMDIAPYKTSAFYETPNLAKLADTGTTFTNAYAACPVCSPTRSAILTGQYPARTRNTDYFGAPNEFLGEEIPADYDPVKSGQLKHMANRPVWPAPYLGNLSKSHTTLAEALKSQGYATFFAGKWHLGPEGSWPTDHGFDINMGGHKGGGPYGGKGYFSPYNNPNLPDGPDGEHLPDRLARETAKFIAAHKDKPFLAYFSFYSVHTPLMGRADLVAKYEAKRKAMGLEDAFAPEPPRNNRTVQSHAVYAAMVEAMDQAVGTVLTALEENGVADNTLVIFTSDNGGLSTSEGSPTSNLPYRAGKGWLYEGGIREPLLVRLPGVTKPGSKCAYPATSTDYFPTILEAAQLPALPKQHVDGVSLVPALRDPALQAPERPLFWHYPHWGNQGGIPGAAVRLGDWKYIEFFWKREPELYDLSADPGEKTNLAATRPDKAKELKAKLDAFHKDTKALMPTPNTNRSMPFEKW